MSDLFVTVYTILETKLQIIRNNGTMLKNNWLLMFSVDLMDTSQRGIAMGVLKGQLPSPPL